MSNRSQMKRRGDVKDVSLAVMFIPCVVSHCNYNVCNKGESGMDKSPNQMKKRSRSATL